MGAEKSYNQKSMLELQAQTVMESTGKQKQEFDIEVHGDKPLIVEVDLTAAPCDTGKNLVCFICENYIGF